MHPRFIQDTRDAHTWPRSQTRRSADAANIVEYGVLAALVMAFVAVAATFTGSTLNGVFTTVAGAIEQTGGLEHIVSFSQRTNRKGAPVERQVSGELPPLASLGPFQELALKER